MTNQGIVAGSRIPLMVSSITYWGIGTGSIFLFSVNMITKQRVLADSGSIPVFN